MAVVVKSDDGSKIMVLDNGFAASFNAGIWTAGALFNGYELEQSFNDVEDVLEIQKIIVEARRALGGFQQLATA